MKIRFYDMNEAREAAGLTSDDLDVEITDEIHVVYDGIRDGDKWVASYSWGWPSDGSHDGWRVTSDDGERPLFSDWVVIA